LKLRLENKLILRVGLILVAVIFITGIVNIYIFKRIITNKVVEAKIQQLDFMGNNLEDIYIQGEKLLMNTAKDTVFRDRVKKFVNAITNLEIHEAQINMDFYIAKMFENYSEFSHIFIASDNIILMKEKGVDTKRRVIDENKLLNNFFNETQLEREFKKEFPSHFSGNEVYEESFVITKVDDETYLGGIITLENSAFNFKDSVVIADNNNRIIYIKNSTGLNDQEVINNIGMDYEGTNHLTKNINGRKFLVMERRTKRYGFECRLLYDINKINFEMLRLVYIYLLLAAATPVLCYFVYKRITKSIAKPLNDFKEIISETDSFNMDEKIRDFTSDRVNRANIGRQTSKLFVFNIIPITIISLIVFAAFYNTLINITKSDYSQLAKQVVYNIEYSMNNYLKLTRDISLDEKLQYSLLVNGEDDSMDRIISSVNSKALAYKNINNIRILNSDREVLYTGNEKKSNHLWNESDYKKLESPLKAYIWKLPQSENQATSILWGVKYLPELQDEEDVPNERRYATIGYIEIDIGNMFENTCKSLQNDVNKVVIKDNSNGSEYYAFNNGENRMKHLTGLDNQSGKKIKSWIILRSSIQKSDWSLFYAISNREIIKSLSPFIYIGLIIILASILLALAAGFYTTRTITRPLKNLNYLMSVANMDTTHDMDMDNKIEDFAAMARNFGIMLNRLKGLSEQIKEKETERLIFKNRQKKAEMITLQSQINPHFLYNALISINSLLVLKTAEKNKEAIKMIKLLSKLYRIGIYRGRIVVSMEEEIEHAKTYFSLQRLNYNDNINMIWDIEKDTEQMGVLKFTLQPLVENAILYGMENGRTFTIRVEADIDGDFLFMKVKDNGKGIGRESLESIRDNIESKKKDEHMGLSNMHERIQLYFGEKYGLYIDSKTGAGTVTTLKLPVITAEELSRGEYSYEI